MAKKSNIVRFRRTFHFNIGFVIFFIIIVYVIFNIFSYLTSNPISEYQVSKGTITSNNVYRGLALRDETVYYAPKSGYVNRYIKNNTKASVYDVVCSIDTDGSISKKLKNTDANKADAAMINQISSEISDFSNTFSMMNYPSASGFKSDLNSEISQSLNAIALSDLEEDVNHAVAKKTFFKVTPDAPGVVEYYVDGMESCSVDTFTKDDFKLLSSSKQNLDIINEVSAEDPIFKMIGSDEWDIVIMVSDELAKSLLEESNVKVKFQKDGFVSNATFTFIKQNGEYFMVLHFKSAMIRYSMDRHLDVELLLNATEGLKIPNSSITKKEFFVVPKNCFYKKEDDYQVLKRSTKDGKTEEKFVSTTIYYEEDDNYYIDSESVSEGDTLIQSNSNKAYVVGKDKSTLEGVYNINKGYAVFKRIEILFQNEEYTVVESKTKYGISLYDHIALDGSKISENDFITMK